MGRDESSGHRRYNPAAVETIEALSCLRSTGMSVRDMRPYLETGDGPRLRELFQDNAERVAQEIERMRIRLRYLQLKGELWAARERRRPRRAASATRLRWRSVAQLRRRE